MWCSAAGVGEVGVLRMPMEGALERTCRMHSELTRERG